MCLIPFFNAFHISNFLLYFLNRGDESIENQLNAMNQAWVQSLPDWGRKSVRRGVGVITSPSRYFWFHLLLLGRLSMHT
jgi:hypothetical protein